MRNRAAPCRVPHPIFSSQPYSRRQAVLGRTPTILAGRAPRPKSPPTVGRKEFWAGASSRVGESGMDGPIIAVMRNPKRQIVWLIGVFFCPSMSPGEAPPRYRATRVKTRLGIVIERSVRARPTAR